MKLKVLPPTLRKNNRYLALDIKVKSVISKDDLVNIVWNGCIRFFGENGTGNFSLWVMKFYELEKTDEYNHYQAILRCQREYVDEVRASLALIYKHNRKDISVSTIGLSGTIKACQKFIENKRKNYAKLQLVGVKNQKLLYSSINYFNRLSY